MRLEVLTCIFFLHLKVDGFNSKLVRLETFGTQGWTGFAREFQFQTGSIRRLSKININIILYPYSFCQVNFYFYQIREQSAVDHQSCKISGRLTALCVERVYRQYYAKFGKLSGTKLVNFRRSTADCLNRFCWTACLKQVRCGILITLSEILR